MTYSIRIFCKPAALLVLTGLFLTSAAMAQDNQPPAPAAPQPAPAPAAAPPAPLMPPVISKPKPRVAKSDKEVNTSKLSECIRTGQRVIAALARDDSGTAGQFYTFYKAFNCPAQQLAQSFGCLVDLQAARPDLSNPSADQVRQCWDAPTTRALTPPKK